MNFGGIQNMRDWKSITLSVGFTVLVALLSSVSVEAEQNIAPRASSQTPSQSPRLRGTIKDPSGAVMPGVDISVISSIQGKSSVIRAGKTNTEGEFSFDLPAGQYQLAVTAPDFKTAV